MTLRTRWLCTLALLPIALTSCSGGMNLNATAPQLVTASGATSVEAYDFELNAGFQIASIDESDKAAVEPARQSFEQDLRQGRTEDYKREKTFSIHLLSGSEGNYFTSPEFLQNSLNNVLATLVVMDSQQNALIFKGQYDNSRFVFADPSQQFELDTRTKAYLLTAGADFQIQTYKGELVPDSELAAQAGGEAVTTVAVSETSAAVAVEPMLEPANAPMYAPPGMHAYPPMPPEMGHQFGYATAVPNNAPVMAGFYPGMKAYPSQPAYQGVMLEPVNMQGRSESFDPFAESFVHPASQPRAVQNGVYPLPRADYQKAEPAKPYQKAIPAVKAKPAYARLTEAEEQDIVNKFERRSRVTLPAPIQP